MSYILHLETSTKVCSVALSREGKLVQLTESHDENYSHGEKLTLFIEEVLSKEKIDSSSLSAVSVASGPGSYTGLRIGVSVAKGLCYSLKIPLIAVDSLTSLAQIAKLKHPNQTILPMIDARRMEVFCSIFQDGKQIQAIEAVVLDENSFVDLDPFIVCGDAATKLQEIWKGRNVTLDSEIVSSASGQITMAWEKFQKEQTEDVAYFEPFYLKDFIIKKRAD